MSIDEKAFEDALGMMANSLPLVGAVEESWVRFMSQGKIGLRQLFENYEAAKATEQPVDWTEDFAHENGNYQYKCSQCGVTFMGHKRRVLCKACALPPCPEIEPIRKLAREVGYAIGEHGSKVRDFDLIAAPWSNDAVDSKALVEHLCKGLNAKIIDEGAKPHGRYVYIVQLRDRWLKHIDLSIMPTSPERETVNQERWWRDLIEVRAGLAAIVSLSGNPHINGKQEILSVAEDLLNNYLPPLSDLEDNRRRGSVEKPTEDVVLPYDVTVGATVFRAGVKLSTFVNAARRWYDGYQVAVTKNLDLSGLRATLSDIEGEASYV